MKENPYIPSDYVPPETAFLEIPWIADKEEFDEVVNWFGKVLQGYSIKHIAKQWAYDERELVEDRLERLYAIAVPVFLDAVRAQREAGITVRPEEAKITKRAVHVPAKWAKFKPR